MYGKEGVGSIGFDDAHFHNMDKRLLIISNNVLSETSSNGKTILSYIDSIPKECVAQLYFSPETPRVEGYKYFRISDRDILHGVFNTKLRGHEIEAVPLSGKTTSAKKKHVPKNSLARLGREALWSHKWRSAALIRWLDDFKPTSVFFHAGDSVFAHKIFSFIVDRYKPKTTVFVTDDYVMPIQSENAISKYRRKLVRNSLGKVLDKAQEIFTISPQMRDAYKGLYDKDSSFLVNLTEPLLREEYREPDPDSIIFTYAGTLYFGREENIGLLADAVQKYNTQYPEKKKLVIHAYTSNTAGNDIRPENPYLVFCGRVNKDELIKVYNKSNFMLFVESFDSKQAEKTKYSLSTKVPEYLSLRKPILAIGPAGIGSMEYLRDVAACAFDAESVYEVLFKLVESKEMQDQLSEAAYSKYIRHHNREQLQQDFVRRVFA